MTKLQEQHRYLLGRLQLLVQPNQCSDGQVFQVFQSSCEVVSLQTEVRSILYLAHKLQVP
ncbi:MAG: hypothetical protein EBT95_00535 [Verrucomicrobia bacterium]|nr:hypothetical protein [Verrucomicrobiota bacterium]